MDKPPRMASRRRHSPEVHRTERIGWLRAAVLGANDGIISTTSLMAGVAASRADHHQLVMAGLAGLVAGAMSMAAGEYVSVSSQSDSERADTERERVELATEPELELQELADIYAARGLSPGLAAQVAQALMAHDALGAHVRDELGLSKDLAARPGQAAVASALSFTAGALLPFLVGVVSREHVVVSLVATSLVSLLALGVVAAWAGGVPWLRPAVRVTLLGALAMGLTAATGRLFGG